ncbi:MAG TPA: hypothetical protein VNO14_12095, partial [Blastocatellia bacterium]|nr:hypothetical protein [Blastocatellia bacterium]
MRKSNQPQRTQRIAGDSSSPGITLSSLPLILLALLMQAVFVQPAPRPSPEALVLTHVTVIDATGAPPQADMTVVIVGDRIAEIGKTAHLRAPSGSRVIDAKGKFLIPGLWDMHAHNSYKEFLTLFLANGITGVRDMGGSPEEFESLKQWRKLIANGGLAGPRVIAAGIHVDGPEAISRSESLHVESEADARRAIRTLKERGADFVKVYSMLSREAFFAVAAEARREGLTIAGHVPASVSAAEASDAGQKGMEHLFGILHACSSREAELRRETAAAVAKSGAAVFVQEEIGAQLKAL